MTKLTEKLHYRPDEVAELFCVDISTVWRWIRQKRIGHVHTPTGRILVPAQEVNERLKVSETRSG